MLLGCSSCVRSVICYEGDHLYYHWYFSHRHCGKLILSMNLSGKRTNILQDSTLCHKVVSNIFCYIIPCGNHDSNSSAYAAFGRRPCSSKPTSSRIINCSIWLCPWHPHSSCSLWDSNKLHFLAKHLLDVMRSPISNFHSPLVFHA